MFRVIIFLFVSLVFNIKDAVFKAWKDEKRIFLIFLLHVFGVNVFSLLVARFFFLLCICCTRSIFILLSYLTYDKFCWSIHRFLKRFVKWGFIAKAICINMGIKVHQRAHSRPQSPSFLGHVVKKRGALEAAVTGCQKISHIRSRTCKSYKYHCSCS